MSEKWKSLSRVWLFVTPWIVYSPWNSPGQNTGVGSLSLLYRVFPTQGSNPGLLHCRRILHQLSHKRSPRILEWVAYPFSSGFSWPRDQTRASCIAGGFFTNWDICFIFKGHGSFFFSLINTYYIYFEIFQIMEVQQNIRNGLDSLQIYLSVDETRQRLK